MNLKRLNLKSFLGIITIVLYKEYALVVQVMTMKLLLATHHLQEYGKVIMLSGSFNLMVHTR